MYDVVRGRKTTPNSTEIRPNFGRIAQRCRAESSQIRRNRTSAHLYLKLRERRFSTWFLVFFSIQLISPAC